MDTAEVKTALEKALVCFNEKCPPAPTGPQLSYDSLEAFCAYQCAEGLVAVLGRQPEFAVRLEQHVDGGRSSFPPSWVAPAVLREARRRGAAPAVEWLQRVLSTAVADGARIQILWGVTVNEIVQITDGLFLAPPEMLKDSPQKRQFVDNRPGPESPGIPTYAWHAPRAVLVIPLPNLRYLTTAIEVDGVDARVVQQGEQRRQLQRDIRLCVACMIESPVLAGPDWFEYVDADLQAAVLSSPTGYGHNEVVPPALVNEPPFDAAAVVTLARQFLALEAGVKNRVRIAMDRAHLALIRTSAADKALELAIALEAMLADDKGAHMFKLGLRAGLLVAGTIEDRSRKRAIIEALYEVRSAVVHGGKRKRRRNVAGSGLSAEEIATQATTLAFEIIKRVISDGRFPDWERLELAISQ